MFAEILSVYARERATSRTIKNFEIRFALAGFWKNALLHQASRQPDLGAREAYAAMKSKNLGCCSRPPVPDVESDRSLLVDVVKSPVKVTLHGPNISDS